MIVHKTPAFDRKFKKLNAFFEVIKLFCYDPFLPKLKTHKLKGKWTSFHSFRINYSDRCIFYFLTANEIILYDIGSHEIYN